MIGMIKSKIWMAAVLLFVLSAFSAIFVAADDAEGHGSGTSIDALMSEIREQQGIGPEDRIDPDEVEPALLEELGEAVMTIMVPDSKQHEWMDRMMGGEGSESLAERHRWMGYRYLSGGWGPMGMMMGRGFGPRGGPAPMMGFSPWGGQGDWRYGGMMGFGYGGVLIWIIIAVLITVVIVLAVLYYQRGRQAVSSDSDALDILKKRFARGEINREEYDRIRRELVETP